MNRARPDSTSPPQRRLSILTDMVINQTRDRPQRNFDGFAALETVRIRYLTLFRAEDDRAMEQKIKFLSTFSRRITFFRYASLWNIARHYLELRRSEWIFCPPHYFWWLVLLNRLSLFSVTGKKVCCQFTRHDSFTRRLPTLAKAPPEFVPFYTGHDQIELLERRGAPAGRIKFIEWRSDANWFSPAAAPRANYILCPGNVHRDEQLILELARSTPIKIIRVGQIGVLQSIYSEHLGPKLELQVNVDHPQYLELLRNAALVILPIEACDEPAGITAALEAVSCCIPVLANDSFGVTPLLRAAYGKEPVADLQAKTWRNAIDAALNGTFFTQAILEQGRQHILAHRSVLPEGADWQVLF